jgi:hypothetical protein
MPDRRTSLWKLLTHERMAAGRGVARLDVKGRYRASFCMSGTPGGWRFRTRPARYRRTPCLLRQPGALAICPDIRYGACLPAACHGVKLIQISRTRQAKTVWESALSAGHANLATCSDIVPLWQGERR